MAPRISKRELFDKIISALGEDSWNVLYISNLTDHPLRLHIYKGEESFRIRFYIWNLTHGGGAARPVDEYRIQITGVNQFEPEPGGKTLILGWWNEGNVFAGFDYFRHSGPLGASPSIQIREQTLRNAYINGLSFAEKGNQEIAIAIRPDFLGEYIRNLESLHSFGVSPEDLEVLEGVTEQPNAVNDTVIEAVTFERRTTVASVNKKIRDNSFKNRVLTSYNQMCAFCGMQLKLIDAAHIVPVEYNGTDETSNGIALCALHHRAFDKAIVTLNDRYQIMVNENRMREYANVGLDGGAQTFRNHLRAIILLPPAINDRPHREYINHANLLRGWN